MEEKVNWIKKLPSTRVVGTTDTDAVKAGEYIITLRKYRLPLVDSYIITLAKKYDARIITTDPGIKRAAKELGIEVDHIPPGTF